MGTLHARSGLEIIPRAACLSLLAGQKVGRLGFVVGDQPMVLPVNFAVHQGRIVLRTGDGSMLAAAHGAKVAFEVDDVDEATETGWSVVVQGVAEGIAGTGGWLDESLRAKAGPTWISGPADHYVAITPAVISGRRLTPGPRHD